MLSRTLPIAMLVALVTAAPFAVATHPAPPAGHSCVGGYNPAAYMNICYDLGGTPGVNVGEDSRCTYLIGNLPGCVEYPWPSASFDVPHVFVQGPLCNPGNHNSGTWCQTVLA